MFGAKARSLRGGIVEGPYSRSRRGAANPWVLLRTHIIPWHHQRSLEADRRQDVEREVSSLVEIVRSSV
jgi:hypothetical protein